MADVFVSYSRSDTARVEMLVRAIEAHGLSVWWDRSLEQGADFGLLIEAEIKAAKACIVCWSEAASGSRWVRGEANLASDEKKYVGALIAPGQAALPFNTLNNANLQSWAGVADDMQLLNLLQEVGRLAGRDDIAARAAGMKQALDDVDARERAVKEAERARLAQEQAAEKARRDEEARQERARLQAIADKNINSDALAYLRLKQRCDRFVDKAAFMDAGRSWRMRRGWQRSLFFYTLILLPTLYVAYLFSPNVLNSEGFAQFISFFITLIIVGIALGISFVASFVVTNIIFNEPKKWLDHYHQKHPWSIAFDPQDKLGWENFYKSDYYWQMVREFEARQDLKDMFKSRETTWSYWETYFKDSARLERHIESRKDLADAEARRRWERR